jgi:multiple antibiotic resistance protein
MNWNFYLNFLAAMMSIVNPVGIIPIWTALTADRSKKVRRNVAMLVVLTSFGILAVFLVGGQYLLNFFSIDMPVFKIAGGILLLLVGLSMINGSATHLENPEKNEGTAMQIAKNRFRKIIVPMAIPTLAGPGSITTVILYGSSASSWQDFLVLFGILFFTVLVLYLVFAYSGYLEKKIDPVIFDIFTRLFGIIVAAIAVQFMVEGLGTIFPNWMEGGSELQQGNEGPKNK